MDNIISKSKLQKKNAVKSVEFASGELRFQPLLRSPLKRLPDPLKTQWYHAFVSSDPSSVATVGLAPSKTSSNCGIHYLRLAQFTIQKKTQAEHHQRGIYKFDQIRKRHG